MSNVSQPNGSSKNPFLKREDVQGKAVVGLDANTVGTVSDLGISPDGKVAIQVNPKNGESSNDGSNGLFLSSEEILAIGDVVLLRHPSTMAGKKSSGPATDSNPVTPGMSVLTPSSQGPPTYPPRAPNADSGSHTCTRCNYVNGSNSRFCIKCGQKL